MKENENTDRHALSKIFKILQNNERLNDRDHKAPKDDPQGMAFWNPTSTMASLCHSNAANWWDQDEDPCIFLQCYLLLTHAGSTYDPPSLYSQPTPAKMEAKIPTDKSSSPSAPSSTPPSSSCTSLPSISPSPPPSPPCWNNRAFDPRTSLPILGPTRTAPWSTSWNSRDSIPVPQLPYFPYSPPRAWLCRRPPPDQSQGKSPFSRNLGLCPKGRFLRSLMAGPRLAWLIWRFSREPGWTRSGKSWTWGRGRWIWRRRTPGVRTWPRGNGTPCFRDRRSVLTWRALRPWYLGGNWSRGSWRCGSSGLHMRLRFETPGLPGRQGRRRGACGGRWGGVRRRSGGWRRGGTTGGREEVARRLKAARGCCCRRPSCRVPLRSVYYVTWKS